VAGLLFVVRGLSLPCTTFATLIQIIVAWHDVHGQLPLWQGPHCCSQPSCHPWQVVCCPRLGKVLVFALLNKCSLLGDFAVLALSAVHAVFGILTVLTFGNVHTFGNIHAISIVLAILNLGIFAPLIVVWRDVVVIVSCDQQHKNLIVAWELFCSSLAFILYCCCSLQYNIKNDCSIVNVVVMVLQSILLLAPPTFAIVDVADPH
jgi:hypothetical protein